MPNPESASVCCRFLPVFRCSCLGNAPLPGTSPPDKARAPRKTDFDIADKLYFEPLTPEDVENVVNIEKPDGAVVQFGGQTAIKLTEALTKMGVKILGTSAENVDAWTPG